MMRDAFRHWWVPSSARFSHRPKLICVLLVYTPSTLLIAVYMNHLVTASSSLTPCGSHLVPPPYSHAHWSRIPAKHPYIYGKSNENILSSIECFPVSLGSILTPYQSAIPEEASEAVFSVDKTSEREAVYGTGHLSRRPRFFYHASLIALCLLSRFAQHSTPCSP
ncbi:hypothetical protein GYMLUDRAFT_429853 [Collybiopsis luxurians FD-317 M1]|uniref:Uncharacterized protein n=1 Tax=Collybiopsis luxurians FD-317 M1 TaxID=944289 RepID=A0A0D0CM09_9AGAR|nr:hypothetical protein GYMLUDRAFT_429853 [Collybiopsis luxurians FD-317 M1]